MNSLDNIQKISIISYSIGTIILAGTLVAIIYNNFQQREFHTDALRAWISIKANDIIEIQSNGIKCKFEVEGFGATPAFKFKSESEFYHKDYLIPHSTIRKDTLSKVYSTIFPKEIQYTYPVNKIEAYSGEYTKEKIIKLLLNRKIYVLLFIAYKDFGMRKYHYYYTFLKPEYEKELSDNKILINWNIIKTSHEKYIEVPELN